MTKIRFSRYDEACAEAPYLLLTVEEVEVPSAIDDITEHPMLAALEVQTHLDAIAKERGYDIKFWKMGDDHVFIVVIH